MAKKRNFKPVDPHADFPKLEEQLIKYWKENKIFEKSIESRPTNKTWTFLDGPPFITGLPHYGSLLSSIPKDLFPRFWTMKGYRVRRVWGWDCHGLPAENKVEEKLEIKRKKDIEEKVGVKKFIDECKLYVKDVSEEWEWYVDHVGRWVDFKNAYKTMDTPYMESVMWVFKQMYNKGYIYKGLRVSLYCPHCSTPISNFEVAMDADNYKEVTEPADTYMYQLKDEKDTFLLAWSTTPWNKIVTPALAVNPKLQYVKVAQRGQNYILAKSTIKILKKEPYKILKEFKGADLVGRQFVAHYDYYKIEPGKKAFIVVGADFVTDDEGTGIVTIAAYGEDDLAVMQKENIQIYLHVDEEGKIKDEVPKFGAKYYLDVNKEVNDDLDSRGLVYKEESYTHTVPTCWRCHTRLIFAPQDAWYVNVQTLKPQMKKTNEAVNWFPKHFKYGRYLKSLENAPDWCISRSRYWGSPVPVWECKNGHRIVPGSIKELEQLSGKKISELHKPEIDEIAIKCKECNQEAKRVSEVLDSWIEAGSAPYAERHYPFEKIDLKKFFPPDFIVEYTGQIRAWFYVLHVISTALFGSNAFKNVSVTGVILGTDGRKMSKNYGNYPDPKEMLQKYGGDALRLYLMGSPVMHGEDILISEQEYKLQVRGQLLILWNIYNFFTTYAIADDWSPPLESNVHGQMLAPSGLQGSNVLDRWVLSLLSNLVENTRSALESYDTVAAVNLAEKFIDSFSTWYIRRSRDKVGPAVRSGTDKESFYKTCYHVLVTLCKLLAPVTPFISDEMYRNLTGGLSVHLENWPEADKRQIVKKLEQEMQIAREISQKAHAQRKEFQIKVRQPLAQYQYSGPKLSTEIEKIIASEINVKKVLNGGKNILDTKITPELAVEGKARDIIRDIQVARKEADCKLDEKVQVILPTWPKEFEVEIKKQTLASNLVTGPKLTIVKGKTRLSS